MDKRGNPSNLWIPYKESQLNIRCIQHASHRHNFMSPQNWLCRSERNPALVTLALNSPLDHFNGDQRTPSHHQTDKNHGDSKAQSLTRPTTHAAISTFSTSHNSISSQYSQPFTSLAAPKANPIFHAANKNLFVKIYFDLRHLTSSSSSFYFSQPSEGTNNHKRGNNLT